ncbi:hypothetical protein PBI_MALAGASYROSE_64 [Mycobacterium phage MalagasyRose]|uniref:Uncharacterized protein n=1 Tax=Mycobacterium phage MalagasyRose TaxID=2599870 RepID=A0A5J6TJ99_9CAUD|nr:hypothetical protein QEH39_gp24 [Mycobacterium phage MalagasyRose]QFG08912.1 hypothetical protein PBI_MALAGASYROSE_64 [Mycobacterium phage MalagasyRose]
MTDTTNAAGATQGEVPWWRPVGGVSLEIAASLNLFGAFIHTVTVHGPGGELHKIVPAGLYWSENDRRIQRAEPPAIGVWERVPAPGREVDEVDLAALGKLLDDGNPMGDNGETVS